MTVSTRARHSYSVSVGQVGRMFV